MQITIRWTLRERKDKKQRCYLLRTAGFDVMDE